MALPMTAYGSNFDEVGQKKYFLKNFGVEKDPGNIVTAKKTIYCWINQPWIITQGTDKFNLSYFKHIIQSSGSVEKAVKLGNIEGKRRGQPTARYMNSHVGTNQRIIRRPKDQVPMTDCHGKKLCDC